MADKLTKSQLNTLRNKKIQKYLWVPRVLAGLLSKKLPKNTQVTFDDLYSAGVIELTNQINKIYNNPVLVNRLYDDNKKDLVVGPFFMKGLKNPYPQSSDPGSVKYIKGAILNEMIRMDPAGSMPSKHRNNSKRINKYKDDYFKATGMYPNRKLIRDKLGLSSNDYDEAMYVDEVRKSSMSDYNDNYSYDDDDY
jgi:DNA-directed RNA polymerase specialized sigma subunit